MVSQECGDFAFYSDYVRKYWRHESGLWDQNNADIKLSYFLVRIRHFGGYVGNFKVVLEIQFSD